jgi:hypothetical protein
MIAAMRRWSRVVRALQIALMEQFWSETGRYEAGVRTPVSLGRRTTCALLMRSRSAAR